jgi:uncharacterized protein
MEENSRTLDRITLHVANECNLNCTYCYAKGGNYSEPIKLMTEEKAIDIIDFFIHNRIVIKTIVFFGGEPLLNIKVIKSVCSYLDKHYKNQKIAFLPEFVIITNGTIINSEIIRLINYYHITITVSIDGPKDINDLHRTFKNNRGSYDKIHFFINTLKSNTSTEILFESTFTEEHTIMGYSEDDIYAFMREEFGIRGTVVPIHYYNENHVVENHLNEKNRFFEKMNEMFQEPDNLEKELDENIVNTLYNIANGTPKEMCPIGLKMVAISVDGELYPCHINVGKKHLSLGNISSENIFNNPDKYYTTNNYLKLVKKVIEPCRTCWAHNLCGGCSLEAFFDERTNMFTSLPKKEYCNIQKQFLSELILNIARLQSDSIMWDKFVARLSKTNND